MDDSVLLRRLEKYLVEHNIAPTRFGRDYYKDPRLVFDMRRGRQLRGKNREKLVALLAGDSINGQ